MTLKGSLLMSFQTLNKNLQIEPYFLIIQQMDYLHVFVPGENEYFRTRFQLQDDDEVEIGDYLSVEAFYIDPQEMPDLDDCPLDEEKILDSTLDLTDDVPTHAPSSPSPVPETPTLPSVVAFSEKTMARYREVFKGSKDDTMELNINFKTLLVHYFRELRMLNELSEYEVQHLREFSDRVPSFPSLMLFLQEREENNGIRRLALELFSSTECIRRIMTGRGRMKTKLQMIKFIEKVRLNILTKGKGYKWKDIVKHT